MATSEEEPISSPDEELPFTFKEKTKLFFQIHWRGIICVVAPIIIVPIVAPGPSEKYQWCAYTLFLMAIYWVVECIPLPVTSFLPIFIFPFVGVMDTTTTCMCYMNDTIIMFLGSLMLAYAVEQSGLHKRLALFAIRLIGYSHCRLLFAMTFCTMFVSMWITNTAATTMMVPINFALLKVFEDQNLISIYETNNNGEIVASDITTCYFCAATFSATVGGIGTLVGTATNLVFKGLFAKAYPEAPEYLSFPKFSAFSIPYMVLMQICLYFEMIVMYFGFLRPNSKAAKTAKISPEGIEAAKLEVEENWIQLGKLTFWEFMVMILFIGAMLLFFFRAPQMFQGWGDLITVYFEETQKKYIRDSSAVAMVSFALMMLPAKLDIFKNFRAKNYGDLPEKPVRALLDWKIMNDIMPYSFMFLLGGGFALSTAAKKEHSDLNGRIGDLLRNFQDLPNNFILFFIIVFTVFVTNFASNVAVCNVIAPIAMQMAKEMQVNPLWYNIAAGFSASYCFCLPVGTPGNLVVQSAAKIPTGKMIKAGIFPTLSTIFLTWVCICFWAPVIWPDLSEQLPWMDV